MTLLVARQTWHRYFGILYCLNRRAELIRLVAWARRKRLKGPRALYMSRLAEEETRLLRLRCQNPALYRWAYLAHCANRLLFPPAQNHRRGAAAQYRNT